MRLRTAFRSGFFVLFACLIPVCALADGHRDAVQAALDEMHGWVGEGDKGQGWRRYLRSEDLAEQLALAGDADATVVGQILALYLGETSGLDRKQFVLVRDALQDWHSELAAPALEDLPSVAEAAKSDFTPIPTQQIEATKEQLLKALDRLERFLASGPVEYASGWKKYLKWDVLQAQIQAEDGPDLGALRPVLRSFIADHNGLERDVFTSLRDSLRDYMNTVLYTSRPDLKADYEQRISGLSALLSDYIAQPSSDAAAGIGRALGWLETGGFARELVEAVRNLHGHSNLHVQLSERLLAAGIEDDVDESNRVTEVIMGTRINGDAHLQGRLAVQLVPDQTQASFDITLTGKAHSTNVGYNGPVTIYSKGLTDVNASKRVHVDEEGITSEQSRAHCSVSSRITGIAARSPLVQRIAWRRAAQSKSRAQRIAAGRAASRVARRMDRQAGGMLSDANQDIYKRFRAPLLRREATPRWLRFRTTDQHLFVRMLQADRYQIAADTQPPRLVGDHDLAVRVHQSLVGNLAESLVGGETVTDEDVVEMLEEADLQVPEELRISPDKDPWSITFEVVRPVKAEFSTEGVAVAIRGRRFTRGDQVVRSAIEISAKYKLATTDQETTLARDGDVSVEYINRSQLSVGQVAMKTFLRKKFDALFEPTIVVPDLTLPGAWEKAGELRVQQLDSGTGWLSVGWIQLKGLRTARKE